MIVGSLAEENAESQNSEESDGGSHDSHLEERKRTFDIRSGTRIDERKRRESEGERKNVRR